MTQNEHETIAVSRQGRENIDRIRRIQKCRCGHTRSAHCGFDGQMFVKCQLCGCDHFSPLPLTLREVYGMDRSAFKADFEAGLLAALGVSSVYVGWKNNPKVIGCPPALSRAYPTQASRGAAGGQATVDRHGDDHMRLIAASGGKAGLGGRKPRKNRSTIDSGGRSS